MNELTEMIVKFREERNWKQFHNPKDIAISLLLEAGELLENFQWKSSEEAVEVNRDKIVAELADVLYYVLLLSHERGIDVEEALKLKMIENERKYPVQKAFGSNKKYTEL